MSNGQYEKNIFINCPFDGEYKKFLDAIVFTVIYCGYSPRSALEEIDSSNSRFKKIIDIIEDCKYSVHDISRTELNEDELPRFNMPLELGLFLGAKYLGTKKQRNKNALIIDSERYRYQKFISDISGQDIKSHNNEIVRIIKVIRDWIKSFDQEVASSSKIIEKFNKFEQDKPVIMAGLDLTSSDDITFADNLSMISFWQQMPNDINI